MTIASLLTWTFSPNYLVTDVLSFPHHSVIPIDLRIVQLNSLKVQRKHLSNRHLNHILSEKMVGSHELVENGSVLYSKNISKYTRKVLHAEARKCIVIFSWIHRPFLLDNGYQNQKAISSDSFRYNKRTTCNFISMFNVFLQTKSNYQL